MKPAFTIIEMLVVIGILAVLMGLTVGALASTKRSDKLLATEHLVGDFVRQARHTARTSGAPVEVLVEKDPPRVQGVSQVPVWVEDFDGSGIGGNVPSGLTGRGYQIDLGAGDDPPEHVLADNERLARSASRADGFYLSCHVLPPPITGAGAAVLPLIVVGKSVSGVITRNASVCGLALQAREIELQIVKATDAQGAGGGENAKLRTWEVVGWLGNGSDDPDEISSLEPADRPVDILRDEPELHASVNLTAIPLNPHPLDVPVPLAGGRWVELGLLFEPGKDDWRLVLYRDGVRIAERHFTTPPALYRDSETVVIGQVEVIIGGIPTTHTTGSCLFDDIRIARLATADPTPLPGDVAPDQTYRIVAHPDGRVEVNQVGKLLGAADPATTAAASSDMIFSGSFNKAAKATLTISVDGRVDGKLVTQ